MEDASPERASSPIAFRAVAWAATVLFVAISLAPWASLAKYRWSFVFLVPILWGAFALRRRLLLRPLDFGLFAAALLLHDLGAFGGYQKRFAGLEYDWCVHGFFGFVGGLVLARLLAVRLGLRGALLLATTVLLVTGIGGVHEIVEAASTKFLGQEYGMLHVGPDNPYDTQEDLLCNVLGASLACAARRIGSRDAER